MQREAEEAISDCRHMEKECADNVFPISSPEQMCMSLRGGVNTPHLSDINPAG